MKLELTLDIPKTEVRAAFADIEADHETAAHARP